MAHEIESLCYTGSTPWHGLGTYVGDEPLTSDEAIIKAGLNWGVEKRALFAQGAVAETEAEAGAETEAETSLLDVDTHMAIVRATDQRVLGIVGSKYQPVQNADAFKFVDSLAESGDMRYHTAGSLRGGQRVWMLAKFGQSEIVPNDLVDKFLFFWNTHDGSGALRCLFTNVRVVCANTARMALDEGASEGVYLRHTSNIANRVKEAQKILGLARVESEKFDEFAKNLVKLQMPKRRLDEFLDSVVPPIPVDAGKRAVTMRSNARVEITHLFEGGIGQDITGVRGTGWAAYNAVTEYVNYHRNSRGGDEAQDRRFESSLMGSGALLINKGAACLSGMLAAA